MKLHSNWNIVKNSNLIIKQNTQVSKMSFKLKILLEQNVWYSSKDRVTQYFTCAFRTCFYFWLILVWSVRFGSTGYTNDREQVRKYKWFISQHFLLPSNIFRKDTCFNQWRNFSLILTLTLFTHTSTQFYHLISD